MDRINAVRKTYRPKAYPCWSPWLVVFAKRLITISGELVVPRAGRQSVLILLSKGQLATLLLRLFHAGYRSRRWLVLSTLLGCRNCRGDAARVHRLGMCAASRRTGRVDHGWRQRGRGVARVLRQVSLRSHRCHCSWQGIATCIRSLEHALPEVTVVSSTGSSVSRASQPSQDSN